MASTQLRSSVRVHAESIAIIPTRISLRGDGLGFETRAEAFRRLYDLRIHHKIDVLIDRWISEPAVLESIERDGIVLWRR